MSSLRLGKYLVDRALISNEQLASALLQQRRTGERLGRLLLILGFIRRLELARALADLWGFPFITIDPQSIDLEAAQRMPLDAMLRHRAVPLHLDEHRVSIAIAEEPEESLTTLLHEIFPGLRQDFRVTTEWDIDRGIALAHRQRVVDDSIYTVAFQAPEEADAARSRRTMWLVAIVLVSFVLLYIWRLPTLFLLSLPLACFLTAVIGYRAAVALFRLPAETVIAVTSEELAAIDERQLPSYTVLLPVTSEAQLIGARMRAVRQLHYPADKLDIILLFEEGDTATLAAAKSMNAGPNIRFIVVPRNLSPQLIRACNTGILFARGRYLVVYGQDDAPEADQLRKAAIAFGRGPSNLFSLQSESNYHNWGDHLLTRIFTLERAFWFTHLLPRLDRLGLPVPVGITGNHFDSNAVRELGGWDPFTRFAETDLGIRAAMHGYRAGTVNSSTYHEERTGATIWLRARSHWLMGYLRTALAFWRDPTGMLSRTGWKQSLGFTMLIAGTPLIFLIQPVSVLLALLSFVPSSVSSSAPLLPVVAALAWFNLLASNSLVILVSIAGVFRRKRPVYATFALLNPLYWLLHAGASIPAFGELLTLRRELPLREVVEEPATTG